MGSYVFVGTDHNSVVYPTGYKAYLYFTDLEIWSECRTNKYEQQPVSRRKLKAKEVNNAPLPSKTNKQTQQTEFALLLSNVKLCSLKNQHGLN